MLVPRLGIGGLVALDRTHVFVGRVVGWLLGCHFAIRVFRVIRGWAICVICVARGWAFCVFRVIRGYNWSDMETTFAIIKPDAVAARFSGKILQRIEEAGFQIRAMRLLHMTQREAEGFYAVHKERPFFGSLTKFMSSGPAIVMALEAPDAIKKWRALMGATDPAKAEAGTLRKDFGASIENNATHGSDAPETAAYELGYFFRGMELTR